MTIRPVAIVSGAATGVGAACARWFAARGYNVLVNYRASAAAADTVVGECRALEVDAVAVQGDVAEDADCRRIGEFARQRWGRVTCLVNSAGTTLFRSMSDLDALDAADFARIFAVNVTGVYQMVRAVAPLMIGGGAIVNISSVAGQNGTGSSYAYAASKGALNTLTLSLARNLAPAIRVNAVLPSMIQGRWLREGVGDALYEKLRAKFAQDSALGLVATPEQVAATAGWLATDARLVTGQLVIADAGVLLGRPPRVVE